MCGNGGPGGIELMLESRTKIIFGRYQVLELPQKCPHYLVVGFGRDWKCCSTSA
jgi:hypothetical protein